MQQQYEDMRQQIINIVKKHQTNEGINRLFKTALPFLQELRQIAKATNSTKDVLLAAHEACQTARYKAITDQFENDLINFFSTIGIKNYYINDSEENFLKKCMLANLIPRSHQKQKFRI